MAGSIVSRLGLSPALSCPVFFFVAARTLSYPGNVPTVLRDIEVEYAAQMVRKLDHCALKIKVPPHTEKQPTRDLRLLLKDRHEWSAAWSGLCGGLGAD